MLGKASNSQIRFVALGANVTSSTYGQTIPVIYGMTKVSLYLIWNFGPYDGSSSKSNKKVSWLPSWLQPPTYNMFVDYLIGHNPILNALQFWTNANQWLPLNFAKYSQACSFIGPYSIVIPDPKFYSVIGVTITVPYGPYSATPGTVTFDDYGGQGPQTYTGSYEIPLWNQMMTGPNPKIG